MDEPPYYSNRAEPTAPPMPPEYAQFQTAPSGYGTSTGGAPSYAPPPVAGPYQSYSGYPQSMGPTQPPSVPAYGLPPIPVSQEQKYPLLGFQSATVGPTAGPPTTGQPQYYHNPNPVIRQQPLVLGATVRYGRDPVVTVCPRCLGQSLTRVELVSGWLPWLLCVFLFVIGLGFGCCLIPFCISSVKDVRHTCSRCRHVLGYHTIGSSSKRVQV